MKREGEWGKQRRGNQRVKDEERERGRVGKTEEREAESER